MKKVILAVLTVISLASTAGQAQAFTLLVAVGSPTIKVVIQENGAVEVVQTGKPTEQIEGIEPAAG